MKWYILIIFLVTGLSVAGLLVIFLNLDPYRANSQIKYLFFTSFFMALWGFSASAVNKFELKTDWVDFYRSFKVGFIISIVICISFIAIRYVRY